MRKQKSSVKWIILGLIAAVVTVGGIAFLKKPTQLPYESVVAQTDDLTTYYSFTGNVETTDRQTVTSEKMMQISEIKVKEGDLVKEGAVLIKTTAGEDIKSKIQGEIVNINVEEKAQVMAGTKLLEVVDYENLQIKVKVDEYDLAAIEKGKEATVKLGAINKEIKGNVSSISKEGQIINGVSFFTAVIDLADDESVRIGMSAEVKIISNQASGIVTLPITAVQFDENNKPYVLKKDESGTETRAEITTGINDGIVVEVKSGLESGETVYYTKTAVKEGRNFPPAGMNNTGGDD
ncbi:RND transporter [Desulfosporosinus sp. HMP52]|uniref:efflux RND transporter periplasmic adaptor subunit n=1 Tax=Desulfosporosinus sp. HMP52 TaxID=1487923 RepID=UPI00051FEBCB|nr:HlyD family efflux transporter periplasmic adaptor subunit [Desulfosporosinus sp. HMP52]KGK83918.1 RND transporter [Desulfosporosinus sp. HMP52]